MTHNSLPPLQRHAIPSGIVSLADHEERARQQLDDNAWAYFSGGAADEITLRANPAAWSQLPLQPRVLRRLRRLSASYGASPVFVCASATISEPDAVAASLIGADDVVAVTDDGSPAPALDVVLLEPTPSLTETAARLLAGLTENGQAIAFTTSRVQSELVAIRARELSSAPERIAAYRGGYLPEERRALERDLHSGELLGLAATTALELGVDVSGLDAVVICGYPGTRASLWQQAGRAGPPAPPYGPDRRGAPAQSSVNPPRPVSTLFQRAESILSVSASWDGVLPSSV